MIISDFDIDIICFVYMMKYMFENIDMQFNIVHMIQPHYYDSKITYCYH